MITKIYRIKGTFIMGDETHKFTKELKATNEDEIREKLYSIFGSKHRINRNQISIDSLKEITPEEVIDPILKDIL